MDTPGLASETWHPNRWERQAGRSRPMKIIFFLIAAIVGVASIYADYKWRQWMAARRRDLNDHSDR